MNEPYISLDEFARRKLNAVQASEFVPLWKSTVRDSHGFYTFLYTESEWTKLFQRLDECSMTCTAGCAKRIHTDLLGCRYPAGCYKFRIEAL